MINYILDEIRQDNGDDCFYLTSVIEFNEDEIFIKPLIFLRVLHDLFNEHPLNTPKFVIIR